MNATVAGDITVFMVYSLQMIESQGELRDTQEKVKELQGKILNLETSRRQMDDQREQENCEDGQLEKLRDQVGLVYVVNIIETIFW